MKQQDKLKHSLRDYYDNQEVPFDDNEWERAGAYLNNAKRWRAARYTLSVLALFSSAMLIVLLNSPAPVNTNTQLAAAPSKQELKPVPDKQPVTLNAPVAPLPESKKPLNANAINALQPAAQAIASAPASPKNNGDAATASDVAPSVVSAPKTIAATQQKEVVSEETAVRANHATTPENIVDVVSVAENTGKTQEEITPATPEEHTEKELLAIRTEHPASAPAQAEAKEITPVPADAAPQKTEPAALNENKKELPATAPENSVLSPEPVSPVVAATPGSNTISAPASAVEDSLLQALSAKRFTGEGIFYEAGVAGLYGWSGPVHRDAQGLSPIAGISYMNGVTNRCALSFGLQYMQVANLSNSNKTSRVSSYRYGEYSRVTVITPTAIHYVVAPLRFHYFVDRKNILGAGLNLAYLLNVDAKVTSYDERPGFTGNYETTRLSGYNQGFSWYDSQLALFYAGKINRSLGIQAELFMGLTDIKQDKFFGISGKERNSGAKLSLVYYAFRKK